MSWGEIKKAINTNLTEPLNYLHWINDLATFGTDGYVYKDSAKLTELFEKSQNALLNKYTANFFLDTALANDEKVGSVLYGLSGNSIYQPYDTLAELFAVGTVVDAIIADLTIFELLIDNENSIPYFFNDLSIRLKVWTSEEASNLLVANENARTYMLANVALTDSQLVYSSSFGTQVTTKKSYILDGYLTGAGSYYWRYTRENGNTAAYSNRASQEIGLSMLSIQPHNAGVSARTIITVYVEMEA